MCLLSACLVPQLCFLLHRETHLAHLWLPHAGGLRCCVALRFSLWLSRNFHVGPITPPFLIPIVLPVRPSPTLHTKSPLIPIPSTGFLSPMAPSVFFVSLAHDPYPFTLLTKCLSLCFQNPPLLAISACSHSAWYEHQPKTIGAPPSAPRPSVFSFVFFQAKAGNSWNVSKLRWRTCCFCPYCTSSRPAATERWGVYCDAYVKLPVHQTHMELTKRFRHQTELMLCAF